MDTDTCITNSPTSDEFKCENAESQLKADDKDAFLFNLTMNPQRGPDKKRIRKPEKTKSERLPLGEDEEDERYLSLLEREKERREALNRSIISFQVGQGGGRMQRRRKRKRKRTQKRRRKKRKRRTRR